MEISSATSSDNIQIIIWLLMNPQLTTRDKISTGKIESAVPRYSGWCKASAAGANTRSVNLRSVGLQEKITVPNASMQSSCAHRKSALSLSVSIETLIDNDYQVVWPDLSASEIIVKTARWTSSTSNSAVGYRHTSVSYANDDGEAKSTQSPSSKSNVESCENFAASALRQSTSLCSPFVKDDEMWRDFL